MRRQFSPTLAVALAFIFFLAQNGPAAQQNGPESQAEPRWHASDEPGPIAFGTITSVGVDRFEIKKRDGSTQTILVDEKTRYRPGQQEVQLEDLKLGYRVLVRGQRGEANEFVASMVRRVTDEEKMARFQAAGERAFGEIVSIDKDQLKLRNRFQGGRTVVVNGQTVFMKEGQPISMKDLRVGDRVVVFGKETDGRFVATRVITGRFPARFQQMGGPDDAHPDPDRAPGGRQEPSPRE